MKKRKIPIETYFWTTCEIEDTFPVFEKAFESKTLGEYGFFLNETVRVSLSLYKEAFDWDLTTPHIYLVTMQDAVQVMSERGVGKIKNK